jgi:hypothetical protein
VNQFFHRIAFVVSGVLFAASAFAQTSAPATRPTTGPSAQPNAGAQLGKFVKQDAPADLKAMIADCISLIEAEKFDEFVDKYTQPAVKEFMEKRPGGMKQVVDQLKKDKGKGILEVLKKVNDQQPEINTGENKRAMYKDPHMSFDQVDGKWYLGS